MKQKRKLFHTAVAVFLSINIQVSQDQQVRLLTFPLLSLTSLLMRGWRLRTELSHLVSDFTDLFNACAMAAAIYWQVGEIITRSVWWGVRPVCVI
jgi:hypothetical protein